LLTFACKVLLADVENKLFPAQHTTVGLEQLLPVHHKLRQRFLLWAHPEEVQLATEREVV